MIVKPNNWDQLSREEKRTIRLEAWAAGEAVSFESQEARNKYQERAGLLKDAFELKKVPARVPVAGLGDTCCIMGNVPISMIATGTAEQVGTYCKDLIDYCGKGSGFILATSTQLDEGQEETVRALVDFPKTYAGNSQMNVFAQK